MQVSVGCTGWSYAGWVGPFYPKNLQQSRFLEYYSKFFDLTEVNSTFYRIPAESDVKRWNAQTPAHFRFTAKLPWAITHEKRLGGARADAEKFLDVLKPLDAKYVLTVVQLPPSLSFDQARPGLEDLLSLFSSKIAIEGRHRSWFAAEAVRYMRDKNICLVWNDVDGVQNPLPITSDFVYLRIIGDRQIQDRDFGKVVRPRDDDLKKWAEKIRHLQDSVMFAAVLANNHYEGFAAVTANKLRVLLGLEKITWKNQKSLVDF